MAKNENDKHDHKWTKLLKVGIFACMMLAPLFAIGVKCTYVTFNKNAKDSYYGNTINDVYYTEITNFEQNKNYHFNSTFVDNTIQSSNVTFTFDSLNNYNGTINFNTNVNNGFIYWNAGSSRMFMGLRLDTGAYSYYSLTDVISFEFVNLSVTQTQLNNLLPYLRNIEYNNYSYLDNVFYYAVNQMKENELFNWTQNTAIYNGVNAVTTGLGITTDAIPILLVYWILLTLIYVIFDIVIETFTWLTHIFSNKVIK